MAEREVGASHGALRRDGGGAATGTPSPESVHVQRHYQRAHAQRLPRLGRRQVQGNAGGDPSLQLLWNALAG